jgi:hypothetical protein
MFYAVTHVVSNSRCKATMMSQRDLDKGTADIVEMVAFEKMAECMAEVRKLQLVLDDEEKRDMAEFEMQKAA